MLEYQQNVEIQLTCQLRIPTDGLVLRGWYGTLTLAVYGAVAKLAKERAPPSPPPVQSQNKAKRSEHEARAENVAEWVKEVTEATRTSDPFPEPVAKVKEYKVPEHTVYVEKPPPVDERSYKKDWWPHGRPPEPPEHVIGIPEDVKPRDVHDKPRDSKPSRSHASRERDDRERWESKGDRDSWDPREGSRSKVKDREYRTYDSKDEGPSWHKYKESSGGGGNRGSYEREGESPRVRELDREPPPPSSRERDTPRERDTSRESERESSRQRDLEREREFRAVKSEFKDVEPPSSSSSSRGEEVGGYVRGGRRPKSPSALKPIKRKPRSPVPPIIVQFYPPRPDVAPPPFPIKSKRGLPKDPPPPRKEEPPKAAVTPEPEVLPSEKDNEDLFEPLTPDGSPEGPPENLSDGEIQEGEAQYVDIYEEIVSEEEEMSDVDEDRIPELGEEDVGDECWALPPFNPYQCELSVPEYFSVPYLTPYSAEKIRLSSKRAKGEEAPEVNESARKLLLLLELAKEGEHTDRWVEGTEELVPLLPLGLPLLLLEAGGSEVKLRLLDWALEGLNFEAALAQPQPAYKVRHLKAGIKLVTALFSLDSQWTEALFNRNVDGLLFDLYTKEYMALSLKLMILRALDAATLFCKGMELFFKQVKPAAVKQEGTESLTVKDEPMDTSSTEDGNPAGDVKVGNTDKEVKSGYLHLLDLLVHKQPTRVAVSITALLRKIHVYELLQKITATVDRLISGGPSVDPSSGKSHFEESEGDSLMDVTSCDAEQVALSGGGASSFTSLDAETLISCINELTKAHVNAQFTIPQSKRALPVKVLFEASKEQHNPYPGLYSLFYESRVLESLLLLLSHPETSGHASVVEAIVDFLTQFLHSQQALLSLLSQPDIANAIIRILLQEEVREEGTEESPGHQLGLGLALHLEALQLIDSILAVTNNESKPWDLDDADLLSSLHSLYSLTGTAPGRSAAVGVLTLDRNLQALLRVVEQSGDDDDNTKLRKSAMHGYACDLLLMTVRCSENVSFLETFTDKMVAIGNQEGQSRLHELSSWLAPVKKFPAGFCLDAVPSLCAQIRSCIDDAAQCPGELVTSLRVLQHLVVPTHRDFQEEEHQDELKYKYALVLAFGNDAMSSLLGVLQRLGDMYRYPSLHAAEWLGQGGHTLLAVIKPCLTILKQTLSYIIKCRDVEFKDLTAIPILLRIYALLSSIPQTASAYQQVAKAQADIMETLLSYTQQSLEVSPSDEALSKNLWTQMISEVLKFTMSSPNSFVSGLTVLSELLPLPLPLNSKEELLEEEFTRAVAVRKIWSAHIHTLSAQLQDLIATLAGSEYFLLQQLVRRLCIQLADLASPTALVVVRALLNALKLSIEGDKEPEPGGGDYKPSLPKITPHALRLLTLVSYLLSHPSIKISLLQIIRGSSRLDEKFSDLLTNLCSILNIHSDNPLHIQGQELIVAIVQSLCDPEITFITSKEKAQSTLEQLASWMPSKEHLTLICQTLVDHVSQSANSYSSVLAALRCLIQLSDYDYGFYIIKTYLDKQPSSLHSLIVRLAGGYSKDQDYLSTVSLVSEMLRLLVTLDPDQQADTRSSTVTKTELCSYISWPVVTSPETPATPHPLEELEQLLADNSREEDLMESQTLENISFVMSLLKEDGKHEKELVEPVLPEPTPPSSLFENRAVSVSEIDEDRLSPSYWLGHNSGDESDQEADLVLSICDLDSMATKYFTDFNLLQELEKTCLPKIMTDLQSARRPSPTPLKRKYHPHINPRLGFKRPMKTPFIAPMRGRGGFVQRGGPMMHGGSRANDLFRSRPPNTSRPPSMHVDDFLAMETFPSPGASSAPPLKRFSKEPIRSRGGRGFEHRGMVPGRGRYFSSSSPYIRREDRGRGTIRVLTRGAPWRSRGDSHSMIRGSYTRPPHMEVRSEPRAPPVSRMHDGSYSTHFSRGRSSHWTSTRGKDRESGFQSSLSTRGGHREVVRHSHVRSFTR